MLTPLYQSLGTLFLPRPAALLDEDLETFDTALPADMVGNSGASWKSVNQSLQTSGSSTFWTFNGDRFTAVGDFQFWADVYFHAGSREILNLVFWANQAGAYPNGDAPFGFFFRFDTDFPCGWWLSTGFGTTSLENITDTAPAATWLRLHLTLSGTVATMELRVKSNNALVFTDSYDLAALIDVDHPASGYIAQRADGAGAANGIEMDNFRMTRP